MSAAATCLLLVPRAEAQVCELVRRAAERAGLTLHVVVPQAVDDVVVEQVLLAACVAAPRPAGSAAIDRLLGMRQALCGDSLVECAVDTALVGEAAVAALAAELVAAAAAPPSRLPDLIDRSPGDIDRRKTDTFRALHHGSGPAAAALAVARAAGTVAAVQEVVERLPPLAQGSYSCAVDVLLSFRAVGGHRQMLDTCAAMAAYQRSTRLVREQQAFACNRLGDHDRAERILRELIDQHGASSETYALLGRVYKDRWQAAHEASAAERHELLERAIDAYRRGFEADWRDTFPGINALVLMELREQPSAAQRDEPGQLLPAVRYTATRRGDLPQADYWDHATLLELAVLAGDEASAAAALRAARAAVREAWEPASTVRTLRRVLAHRRARGVDVPAWCDAVVASLAHEGGA